MAILKLSDPETAEALLAHFGEQPDLVAELLSSVQLSVYLVGSYSVEAMDSEVVRRAQKWEATQPRLGRIVAVEPSA